MARGAKCSDGLSREAWQSMLARAAGLPLLVSPRDPGALRETLIEQSLLPEEDRAPLGDAPSWQDIGRDLSRLADLGTRLPPGPLAAAAHRSACLSRLGIRDPAHDPGRLGHRKDVPTVADACLLLADLAVPGSPARDPRATP